jgi:hypothetical protein
MYLGHANTTLPRTNMRAFFSSSQLSVGLIVSTHRPPPIIDLLSCNKHMQSQTPTPHSTFSCAGHFRDAASLYAFSRCSISLCCSERSASGRPSALRQPRSRTPELRALRRSSNSSSNWTRLRRDSTCWHRSKPPCAFGHSVFLPREISRCCRGDHPSVLPCFVVPC